MGLVVLLASPGACDGHRGTWYGCVKISLTIQQLYSAIQRCRALQLYSGSTVYRLYTLPLTVIGAVGREPNTQAFTTFYAASHVRGLVRSRPLTIPCEHTHIYTYFILGLRELREGARPWAWAVLRQSGRAALLQAEAGSERDSITDVETWRAQRVALPCRRDGAGRLRCTARRRRSARREVA